MRVHGALGRDFYLGKVRGDGQYKSIEQHANVASFADLRKANVKYLNSGNPSVFLFFFLGGSSPEARGTCNEGEALENKKAFSSSVFV